MRCRSSLDYVAAQAPAPFQKQPLATSMKIASADVAIARLLVFYSPEHPVRKLDKGMSFGGEFDE